MLLDCMPAASTSMLFTWSIEAVLLGLISLLLARDFLLTSQCIVSCINLGIQLVLLMGQWDYHYAASVSYATLLTALFLASCMRPLDQFVNILVLILLCVGLLVAFGMVFASTESATFLFLSKRGHFALIVPLLMDQLVCNKLDLKFIASSDLGVALALIVVALQLTPLDTVALACNAVVNALLGLILVFQGKMAAGGVTFALLVVSLMWIAGAWIPAWPSLGLSSIQSWGMPVFSIGALVIEVGPWLLTFLIVLFFIGVCGMGIWQITLKNYLFASVMFVPTVIIVVWIVLLWVLKPPINPPTTVTTSRKFSWPRVKRL